MSIPTVTTRVKRALGALRALVVVVAAFTVENAHAEVPQKLKDGLTASSSKVRIVAIGTLAKSKDPQARTLLEPLLADPDPVVRASVVEALGRLNDPAAIKALEKLKGDKDATVAKVLDRVLPALDALRVQVDVGELQDITKGQIPGLIELLQQKTKAAVEKELGSVVNVKIGGVAKGYGLILGLRSLKKTKEGPNTLLEVKCEMTLVELPGKILRVSSNAQAAVGVEGDLPKSLEPELARDGIDACAPSLAKDFADYARQRVLRK